MLDIKVRTAKARRTKQYVEVTVTVYGHEHSFGLLDAEEAEAFRATFQKAAYQIEEALG